MGSCHLTDRNQCVTLTVRTKYLRIGCAIRDRLDDNIELTHKQHGSIKKHHA